jgi:hypothetical protein
MDISGYSRRLPHLCQRSTYDTRVISVMDTEANIPYTVCILSTDHTHLRCCPLHDVWRKLSAGYRAIEKLLLLIVQAIKMLSLYEIHVTVSSECSVEPLFCK